jgi:peptidyl-prolyl cis-trans isomerase C
MKRALLTSSLLALTAAFVVAPAYAAEKAAKAATTSINAYATVNGKAIPANRAEVLMANQLAQGQANTPELKAAVREELVRREVLAQEAAKLGLDKKPEVQGQVDLARQGVLVAAYLSEYARSLKISDADVQKEYEAIKASLGDKEYKARHILVEKEGEAKDIIDKLKKGEKFEDLAKASKDPGSKEKGGDLGWANKAGYVPAFSAAMVKLDKGRYTETPIQTNFGWHVIQLDDVRELKMPPFDDLKAQIIQRMRQVAVEKQILALRAKAKIE